MSKKPHFLVVGSAHLDILSTAVDFQQTLDKPGDLRIEVGGSAYNLAINLIELGARVSFLTAFNESSISHLIEKEMTAAGIELVVIRNQRLPDAGFSAHIVEGEISSAVSSVAVEDHDFIIDPQIEKLVQGVDWIALDCNLNGFSLKSLSNYAEEINKPYSLSLVSESKSLRATSTYQPDLVFCNYVEYMYLINHERRWLPSLKGKFIVTHGDQGAMALENKIPVAQVDAVEVDTSSVNNALGAGDAFAAATLYEYLVCEKQSILNCMKNGAEKASQVIQVPQCNLGNSNVFNRRVSELETMAERDKLTGLNNRTSAEQIFEKLSKGRIPYTLLFLDIDHFKAVNDNYGHSVGDDVIRAVARSIQDTLRSEDFGIRYGGEEFIAIVQCEAKQGGEIGERLQNTIRNCAPIGPVESVKTSMGIAYNDGHQSYQVTINDADEALYYSKENGRDRITLAQSAIGDDRKTA